MKILRWILEGVLVVALVVLVLIWHPWVHESPAPAPAPVPIVVTVVVQMPAVATAQPAATPVAPAQPQLVQPLPAVSAACPTEKEFEALTGVRADIVRTEPCLFHWRGDPQQIDATHPCPSGWSCTLGSNGKNYQYNGDDKLAAMPIFAGSWRLLSQYAANDPVQNNCNFVQKVQVEGQISDPQWTVAPGNFTCP